MGARVCAGPGPQRYAGCVMRAWLAVLLLVSSPAWADYFPYVKHGPVITGVTHAEAWVAWYTSHYQGTPSGADSCYLESLTGTPNATTPTLLVTPAVNGESVFQDPACDVFHQVHLSGLTPGTAYTFELDKPDESGGSATGGFITAPAPGASAKFSFIVFGDNRNNPWPETDTRPDHEAVVGAILARHADAAFVVNGGDYALNVVTVSGDDRGYTEFFDVERALLATHPLVPAMGNHDSIDTTFYDGLMSAGRFAGSRHPYYWSFDWGQVHLAVLDTFEGATTLTSGREPALSDEQAAWLATDLAAAAGPGRLLFLVTHQGPFSYGTDAHGGSPDVQAKVIPLMLQYGVHAILAGHDHFYERGRESCIDFLVVGAGGAPLYGPDPTAPGLFAAA